MQTLFAVLLLAAFVVGEQVVNDRLVHTVNSFPGVTWTASMESPTAHLTREQATKLMGVKEGGPTLPHKTFGNVYAPPASFDARTQWPSCSSIKMIRDQSDCGSCWAFGAVETMSDRECIKRGYDVILSAEEMNSCRPICGDCGGGYPGCAFDSWITKGVVTEACLPYSLPGCDHHIENSTNPCPPVGYDTPECKNYCTTEGEQYVHYYSSDAYYVSGEIGLKNEIYASGPCEAVFTVYDDFLSYTGGIYHHVTGRSNGGHAVKVIGWGEENGTPYWLIANSWNEHWGEKGFFRMLRGNNECGIENSCYAGTPVV